MLLEILDSFDYTEFWYVDQGIAHQESSGSVSFGRQDEKWWLPVPRVSPGGLHEDIRKELQHKRDCANQIHKAAIAINNTILTDMAVPQSYIENLPKNGRASLGDLIYRYINSDQFSPECLIDCLDMSSEHQAIEIANRVEASIYLWRQKGSLIYNNNSKTSMPRSSWDLVKDLMVDSEKRELLADRAESLLFCLKQGFPDLPQTALDICKIQHNKDIGKSILKSYSKVLESLAFNIVARIDDIFYVDGLAKHEDHKTVTISSKVHAARTPYKMTSTATEETMDKSPLRSPFLSNSGKILNHELGVKKIIANYLNNADGEVGECKIHYQEPYTISDASLTFEEVRLHDIEQGLRQVFKESTL